MLRGALLQRRAAHRLYAARTRLTGRCVQNTAAAEAEEEEEVAAVSARRDAPMPTPTPIATAMALAQQLEHPTPSSLIGRSLTRRPDWMPDATGSGLTTDELDRAKQCLLRLKGFVERDCRPRPTESGAPRDVSPIFRAKTTASRLDRMLVALNQQKKYREVEGIAFLWENFFPEFADNWNHWRVICAQYALSLTKQKRYEELVEKLFTNWHLEAVEGDDESSSAFSQAKILSPKVVSALLQASCHTKDIDVTMRVLETAVANQIPINRSAYRQMLTTLLQDDSSANFDSVLRICDFIVHTLGDKVPFAILPQLLKAAAERGELERAMPFYYHDPKADFSDFVEYKFDVCLLTLWDLRYADEMTLVLQHVLESERASPAFKHRICKGILRKTVEERKEHGRVHAMRTTLAVLDLMEAHHIRASNKPLPLLLGALIEDEHIETVDGFVEFFAKYPHVMEWNAYMMCELLLVAVRSRQVRLIDELVMYALNHGIPLKYVALESVVAFYYRSGKFKSVEKAANIISALRKNKHIPLGMALSEIGMMCNLKLGRHEEVAMLFEDFAKLDGERQRVLTRRPMLQAAVDAYTKLRRYDEANAVRQLLQENHAPLVDPADAFEDIHDEESDDGEDADGVSIPSTST